MDLGSSFVELSDAAWRLGLIFNFNASLTDYVNDIRKSSYMHIRKIRRIRDHVPFIQGYLC